MAVQICPECGAICQETDTHCMDCGCDIVEAERKISRRAKQERGGGPIMADEKVISGAAAGMAEAGETSAKVRLKEFDRHLADKLEKERVAVVITAIIALIAGGAILLAGWQALSAANGIEALRALSYTELRQRGLGAFAFPPFVATLLILFGLAGLLCAAGQIERFVIGQKAIAQVKEGERPEVVGISTMTWVGLLIASFVFAPFGIVLGIIFMLGQDDETRRLGSQMIKSGILSLMVIGLHLIWNAIEGFMAQAGSNT